MICLLILDKNTWVNAIFSIGFETLTIYSNLIGLNPIELRNKNWKKEIKLKISLVESVEYNMFKFVQFSGCKLYMLFLQCIWRHLRAGLSIGCGACLKKFEDTVTLKNSLVSQLIFHCRVSQILLIYFYNWHKFLIFPNQKLICCWMFTGGV